MNDRSINFPKERLPSAGPRDYHGTRRVIIVQAQVYCRAASPITLVVVPCSASSSEVGPCDMVLPDGENGFTEPKVVAYVSLMQPVLKSDLDKHCGQLRPDTLDDLQRLVMKTLELGSIMTLDLPPRV